MAGEVNGTLDFMDNDEELVDGYLDELDFLDDIIQPDRNQAPVVSPVQSDRTQATVLSPGVPEKPPDVLEPSIQMPFGIPQDVPLELPAETAKPGENLLQGTLTQDIAERVRAAIAQIRSPKENACMRTAAQSAKPQSLGEGKTKKEIVPLSVSSPIRFLDTIRKLNDSDSLEPGECSDSSEETKKQKRAERFGIKLHKSKIVYNEQVSYLETDKHALDGNILSSSCSYRSIKPDFRGTNSYPSYENYSYSQGQHPDSSYESSERPDFPYGKLSNPVQVGKHITKMHGDEIQLFTRKKIKQHYEQFKVSMSRHKSNSCEETIRTGEKEPGPRLKTNSTATTVPLLNVKEIKKRPISTVDGIELLSVKKRKDSKSVGVDDAVVNSVLMSKNRPKKRVHVVSNIEPNMQVKKVKECIPSAPISGIDSTLFTNMNKRQRQKARKRLKKQLALLDQDTSLPKVNNQNEPDLKEIKKTIRKKRSASIQNSISTDCSSLYEVFDIASPLSEGHSYFNQGTVSPAYHEPFATFLTNTSENDTRKNEDNMSPVSISSLQTVHRSSSPGESIYDGLDDLCLKSPSGVLNNEENTHSNQSFVVLSTTADNSPLQVRDKSPSPVVDSSTSPCIKRRISRHSRRRSTLRAKLEAALLMADNHPTNSNKQSVSSYDDVLSSSAYESSASVQFINSVSQKLPSDGSGISISLSVSSNMSGFSEKSAERAPRSQSLNVRTDSDYGKSSPSRSSARKYRVISVSSSGSVEQIQSPTGSWHSTGSRARSGHVSVSKSSSRRLKSHTKSHQQYSTVSEGKRSMSRNTHSRSRSVSVTFSRNRRSSPSSNPISSSPTRTHRFSSSSRNRKSSRSRARRSPSPSRALRSSSPSRNLRSSPFRSLRSPSPSRSLRSSSPSRNLRSSPSRNLRSSSPSRSLRSSSPSRNMRSSPSRTLGSSSPSRSLRSRSRSRTRRSHAYSRNCRSRSHSKRKRSRSLSRTRLYRSRHSRSPSYNRRSRSAKRSKSPHRATSRNIYHKSRGRGGSPGRHRRSASRSRRRSRIISPLGCSKTALKKSSISRDEALKYPAKPAIATELFANSDKIAPLAIQPTPVMAPAINLTDVNSIAVQPSISNTGIPFPYYSINVQGNNYYNQQGLQPDIPGVGAYTPVDTAGYSMMSTLQVSHHNVEYIRHHQQQQQQQHYHQTMYMQQYPPPHCVPEPHFSGQDIHYTRPNLQPVPSAAAGVPDLNSCHNAAQPSTPKSDPATNQGQKPDQGLSPNKRQNQTLKPGLLPKQGLTLNDRRKTNLISVPVTHTPISMSFGKPSDCSSDITVSKDVEDVLQNNNEHGTNTAVFVGNKLIAGDPNQGKPDKGQAQTSQDASLSERDKVLLCLEKPDLFETSVPNIQSKRDQSKITINLLCNAPKSGASQITKSASVNKPNNRLAWSTKYTDTSTARNFTSKPTVPVLKSTASGSQETLANGIVDRRFSFDSDVTALQEIVRGSVDVVKSCSGLSSKHSLPNEIRDKSNVETIENPSQPVLIDDILKRLTNVLCVAKRTVSTQVTWTGNTFRGSSDAMEDSDNAQNIALYDDIAKLLK